MVWPHRKIVLHVEDNSAENSKKSKDKLKADWELDIYPRQRKTEKYWKEVLQHRQWYPNDLQG